MRSFMKPDALGRSRSENHRETMQAHWFTLVSKLLRLTMGPFSIKMASLTIPPECQHPEDQVASGSNQYGRWKKCLLCKKQLFFHQFGPDNPKPVSRKVSKVSAAAATTSSETMAKIKKTAGYAARASKPAEYVTRQEMQELMKAQADQISNTLTATISQLVQSQQMLQQQMANVMMGNQAAIAPAQETQQMPVIPQSFNSYQNDEPEASDMEMLNPNPWDQVQRQ